MDSAVPKQDGIKTSSTINQLAYESSNKMQGEVEDLASPHQLHRDFKPRQVNMLAIAGAIGTGLIIGSGTGLARGGPASLFLAYIITGSIVYFTMTALGEMASLLPTDQGFNGYARRFVDPALGYVSLAILLVVLAMFHSLNRRPFLDLQLDGTTSSSMRSCLRII